MLLHAALFMSVMSFDESKLKSPAFFAENRVPAHSDHESFASWAELEAGENSLRASLNGLWKFHHAKNAAQVLPLSLIHI